MSSSLNLNHMDGDFPKRKLGEILAIYAFEKSHSDIYVEGVTDQIVMQEFVSYYNLKNTKVYSVEHIDFSEIAESKPGIKSRNKLKVVELANQIQKTFGDLYTSISCIIDRDFDELLGIQYKNYYLLVTDYTSVELYLYEKTCIEKYFSTVLHGFPKTASEVLNELTRVLVDLFVLEVACLRLGIKYDRIRIRNSCKIMKNGRIQFDDGHYLSRFLTKNNLHSKKNELISTTKSIKKGLKGDMRNFIHGHCFIELLFLYINKIKNNIGLKLETLERTLFLCLDCKVLSQYDLFKEIVDRHF